MNSRLYHTITMLLKQYEIERPGRDALEQTSANHTSLIGVDTSFIAYSRIYIAYLIYYRVPKAINSQCNHIHVTVI